MSATVSTTSQDGGHIRALDGIRGVAILMVVVYHFYVIPTTQSTRFVDTAVFKIAEVGWAGVDLFFVLSGFLITGILLDAKAGSGYFRPFYARRFLRIFPVYYLTLALLIFVLPLIPWFAEQQPIKDVQETQFWFWTYLINIRAAFEPLAHTGFATGHFWSLALEEQFYLLWPAVVLVCTRRTLGVVCTVCIVTAFAFRVAIVNDVFSRLIPQLAATTLMPARMDGLAMGALIALAARNRRLLDDIARRWLLPMVGGGLGVVVLLIIFTHEHTLAPNDVWVRTVGFSALAVLFAAMLAAALTASAGSLLHRLLGNSVLLTFGRYSYGLYVVHLPIAVFLFIRYSETNEFPLVAGSDIPARTAFAFVGVSLSLAIAWGSWHLFESQVLKLKRFFPYGTAEASGTVQSKSEAPMVLPGAEVRP